MSPTLLSYSIPSNEEDPQERRRLLNILAQRRYRQRKRARQAEAALEEQSTVGSSEQGGVALLAQPDIGEPSTVPAYGPEVSEAISSEDVFLQDAPFDFNFEEELGDSTQPASVTADYTLFGILTPLRQQTLFTDQGLSACLPSEESGIQPQEAKDHMIVSPIQLTPSEAARLSNARTTSGPHSPPRRSSSKQLAASAFSDEAYMSTPALSLLRAHITVLERLRGGRPVDTIWNPFAVSTLWQPNSSHTTTPPSPIAHLPPHYQPLPSQRMIKHHPVIDLLPWPDVRNKLLFTLSLPADARPPRAKGEIPDVIMNLKFDMMDASGGIRVWGQDPFNQDNWEIGQRFFEYWWWALDNEVLRQSNALRVRRGEDVLRLREVA